MAIVKMKKVLFLTLEGEGMRLMRLVQRLGVLHPEHLTEAEEVPSTQGLEHKLNMQSQILHGLESIDAPAPPDEELGDAPPFETVEAWLGDLRSINDSIASIDGQIRYAEPWGEFEPGDIKELEGQGIAIQLWTTPGHSFDSLVFPEGAAVRVIKRDKQVHFATVSTSGRVSISGAEEADIPRVRSSEMEAARDGLIKEREQVLGDLGRAKAHIDELRGQNAKARHEYEFQIASQRAFKGQAVMAFEGWIPRDQVGAVRDEVEGFSAPVTMRDRDPAPDETPPVLTRNTWIARTFEPLLHLLGLPQYRGLDPALFFAPFMMLFFGICLGDVGYGATIIVAAYIMKRLLGKKIRGIGAVSNMTMLFGVATLVWGLLIGSIFGAWPAARNLIPLDISYQGGDPMILFRISIALAIVHLTIAFVLAAVGAYTLRERMLKIGSIGILIGGVMMVLKVSIWWWVFLAGVGMVLLFTSDSRNPFKRLGLGLWGLYNHVSLLGDVMSYSRLFGLGIASGAIASVVNMLASDAREGAGGAGYVLAILILIVGHLFNITMGIISALVHPGRLHAVEALPKFVQLTGTPYRPLAGERG